MAAGIDCKPTTASILSGAAEIPTPEPPPSASPKGTGRRSGPTLGHRSSLRSLEPQAKLRAVHLPHNRLHRDNRRRYSEAYALGFRGSFDEWERLMVLSRGDDSIGWCDGGSKQPAWASSSARIHPHTEPTFSLPGEGPVVPAILKPSRERIMRNAGWQF